MPSQKGFTRISLDPAAMHTVTTAAHELWQPAWQNGIQVKIHPSWMMNLYMMKYLPSETLVMIVMTVVEGQGKLENASAAIRTWSSLFVCFAF